MSRPALSTRKPIDQLTPKDLEDFPIWEFATGEEEHPERDETWVRPVNGGVIALGQWSLSVAADFETASGRRLQGFVGVTTAEGVELDDAVVLAEGAHVFVSANDRTQRDQIAAALGMSRSAVFPLRFTLRALVTGEPTPRAGALDG